MTATKVVRFLAAEPDAIRSRWLEALRADGAPTRVTLSTALHLDGLPPPAFAAVDVLWFADEAAALDHDGWLRRHAPALVLGDGSCAVVVEEVALRGDRSPVGSYRMMSFGRRNPGLSRAGFLARWRLESGRLGGEAIPDDVRGLAYVQDHPVGDDVAFDAVNEVWFDRLDDLRRRADWFAARPIPSDLMSPAECWSLYLREEVLG
jgi:hypothetical protein